ncbi:UNKNOWN [Stylonychia lemnae]|uniref:Pectin lyase fold/virulence factor n=1 Tax=Stylonychia lemnae TaxID=5949 RepID=A0A077ZXL0_STYLE|nr:UNKNOWN [Stylonychia lemnae]|eukprot:CDW74640.1 UNKNOWN [Stylonychia lemnae]
MYHWRIFSLKIPNLDYSRSIQQLDLSSQQSMFKIIIFYSGDTVDDLKIQNLTLNNIDCNCSKNHSLIQLQAIYAELVDINVSNINTNYNMLNSAAEFGSQVFQIVLRNDSFDQDILKNGYFKSIQGGALSLNPETTTSQDDLDGIMAIQYLAIFNSVFLDNYEILPTTNGYEQFGYSTIPYFNRLNFQSFEMKVTNSIFEGCRFGYLGGVFHLDGMNNVFISDNSTFLNNFGWYGGIVYCSNCYAIVFFKSNITETQAYQGGVLFTEIDKPVLQQQIIYTESIIHDIMSCSEGGLNYIVTNSYTSLQINLQESRFEKVNASFYDDSSSYKLTKTSSDQLSFQGGAGFFIVGGVMKFKIISSFILNLQCNSEGAFIFAEASSSIDLEIRNCTISNVSSDGGIYYLDSTTGILTFNDTLSIYSNNSAFQGAIYQCGSCTLNLDSNIYENNFCYYGCVAYTGGDYGRIQIQNCSFTDNHALIQGGAIYQFALEFSTSMNMIVQNSKFQMNLAKYWLHVEKRFVENEIGSMMISVVQTNSFAFVNSTVKFINTYSSSYLQIQNIYMLLYLSNLNLVTFGNNTVDGDASLSKQYIQLLLGQDKLNYNFEGIVMIRESKTVILRNNSFRSICLNNLGAVGIYKSSNLTAYNSIFDDITALNGPAMVLQYTNSTILNMTFNNNNAQYGGAIQVLDESIIAISQSNFTKNYAFQEGGALLIKRLNPAFNYETNVSIDYSYFQGNYATKEGGVFKVDDKYLNLVINSGYFNNNQASQIELIGSGGTFYGSQYKLIILNNSQIYQSSAYEGNGAIFGGVFQVSQSVLTLYKSTLYENYGQDGGVISVDNQGQFNAIDCTFQFNTAIKKGGVINLVTKSTFNLKDSLFTQNYASENSVINVLESSETEFLKIENCSFTYNEAEKNTIQMMYAHYSIITNSLFEKNVAQVNSKGLFVGYSNLTIENTTFIGLSKQITFIQLIRSISRQKIVARQTNNKGTFINGIMNSNITIINSQFMYGSGTYDSEMTIKDSYFRQNVVLYSGGAVYAANFKRLDIYNTTFEQNLAEEVAGTLKGQTVNEQGGSIMCTDCGIFFLYNAQIIDSKSTKGGSIYLEQTNLRKTKYSDNMAYSTINSRSLTDGGAIYLHNLHKVLIQDNQVIKNIAENKGGGIYMDCQDPYNCKYEFGGINSFKENQANSSGGAIQWNDVKPTLLHGASYTFKDNSALIYADDIASYPQKLIKLTLEQYNSQIKRSNPEQDDQRRLQNKEQDLQSRRLTLQTSSAQDNQRSGDKLPIMYLALVDQMGQVVGTESSKKLDIQIKSTLSNGSNALKYQASIIGTKCIPGEMFAEDGSCDPCPAGKSYSLVKMTEPGQCSTCPSSKAVCNGGSNVGPQKGYWRRSNTSSTFIQCFNKGSCLGMIPPQNNPQGSCLSGYNGILCADCIVGYSRTGTFECGKCPEYGQNLFRIIAIILVAIIVIIFLIRSTLNGAADVKNTTSVFQKIILNHIQLIVLTASFDFKWPQIVLDYFKSSETIGEASNQIFSIDCFLNNDQGYISEQEKEDQKTGKALGVRIFYIKLALFGLLPVFLVLISSSFWFILYNKPNQKLIRITKAISTVVILLFLVHPNIVKFVFNLFNCIDIDGEKRVKNDLEILCYVGEHIIWALGIGLPSLVVWGLGIPLFAFVLLERDHKSLDSLIIRQKYGFLYRGFKRRFYYWEIVITYRKIFLIFIQIFLVQYGVITQAMLVLMMLIIFMAINLTKQPFQTQTLNELETLSLITSLLTIFCGVFFIVSVDQTDLQSNQNLSDSQVILLSNLIFFTFWTFKMVIEIKHMLMKKFSKIYIFLFLCNNKQKYHIMMEINRIKEENEILREKYQDHLKQLMEMCDNGELLLNQKNLEKLLNGLSKEKILKIVGIQEEQQPQISNRDHYSKKRINRPNKNKLTEENIITTLFKKNKRGISNDQQDNEGKLVIKSQELAKRHHHRKTLSKQLKKMFEKSLNFIETANQRIFYTENHQESQVFDYYDRGISPLYTDSQKDDDKGKIILTTSELENNTEKIKYNLRIYKPEYVNSLPQRYSEEDLAFIEIENDIVGSYQYQDKPTATNSGHERQYSAKIYPENQTNLFDSVIREKQNSLANDSLFHVIKKSKMVLNSKKKFSQFRNDKHYKKLRADLSKSTLHLEEKTSDNNLLQLITEEKTPMQRDQMINEDIMIEDQNSNRNLLDTIRTQNNQQPLSLEFMRQDESLSSSMNLESKDFEGVNQLEQQENFEDYLGKKIENLEEDYQ